MRVLVGGVRGFGGAFLESRGGRFGGGARLRLNTLMHPSIASACGRLAGGTLVVCDVRLGPRRAG